MTVVLFAGIAGLVAFSDPRRIWRAGAILGSLCLAAAVVMGG